MKNITYLDNSATTMPCEKAILQINNALKNDWGNPSSLHIMGMNAQIIMDNCRKKVAKIIGANDNEIYFTSGGTEANNMALYGAAMSRAKRGNRIVSTTIEHPSVLNLLKNLEDQGFEVIYISPTKDGVIDEADLRNAINEKTILVSIMLVNNEIGSIQPIKTASEIIKNVGAPALLHCDAVQAFGKMNINVKQLGVDLMSASGHKIHASKGIGFLYKKNSVTIKPLIYGGGQEKNLRSGTESIPLIAGLEGALDELQIDKNYNNISVLYKYALDKLHGLEFVTINSPTDGLPYIINVSVVGYRSETLLHYLESKNIFVSSGSACSKGNISYVLNEIGLDKKRIDSALRISFCRYNTKADVDLLCTALGDAVKILRKA